MIVLNRNSPQAFSTNSWRGWGYLLAVVATTSTLAGRLALSSWFGDRAVLVLFILPIFLSAYVGGLGPGLVATILAAIGTAYFVLPPTHTFLVERPVDVAQWVILVLVGVLISVLTGSLHASKNADKLTEAQIDGLATERKVRAGFALALALLVLMGLASGFSVTRLREDAGWATHTQQVISSLRLLLATTTDMETAVRSYISTGQEGYLDAYGSARHATEAEVAGLRKLTADNVTQQAQLDLLAPAIARWADHADQDIAHRRNAEFATAQVAHALSDGSLLQGQIKLLIEKMEATEQGLLQIREERVKNITLITRAIIIGGGTLAFVFVTLALFIMQQAFAVRRRTEAALREARDQLELRVRARTSELEQSNAALQVSEDLFAKAFQLSPDCLAITRLVDRVVIRANDAVCRLWGGTPREIIGRPGRDYMNWLSEEERLRFMDVLQQTGECLNYETSFRIAGHRLVRFIISSRLINMGGFACILTVMRDITEKKRTEIETARLAAIVQSSDDAIIGYDLDGHVTSWNTAAEKIFGYLASEIVEQPILLLSPPDRQQEEVGIIDRLRRGEFISSFETMRLRKDGALIAVSITVSPIKDSSGQIIGASKIARDITASNRAAAALRESEDRFRTMANSMSQLAWIAQADGFITWYNRRWYEYTGTTPEQMEGWGWQAVHDPEVLPVVMVKWKSAIESARPFEMEFPLRGSDGRFRTFLTRAEPMKNAAGAVVQWFGTNTDVDVLKQMEVSLRTTQTRLNSTLAAGLIGTWTWDIPHDRLVADEFTARAFSIDTEAAAQGLSASAYLAAVLKEDQPGVSESLARAIASCGHYDIEYRVRQKNGELLWLQARGRVEGDAAGQAVSFHGAVVDITARKQAEAAVRESEGYFRFLNDLALATRSLADPAQVMAVMAKMLGRYLRVSRCAYADVETDGESFIIQHDYTDGCTSTVGRYQLSFFGARAVSTLHRGETLVIRDAGAELSPTDGADMFKAIDIQAIITCPLVKDGGLRAMMAVHQTTARDWKAGEISIVEEVVERCWATIERRVAEEKIRLLNADLENRVAQRTVELLDANNELQRGRDVLVNLFESLPGLYLVLNPDFTIVTASDAYTTATMTTREGLIGRGLFEVFPDNPAEVAATGVSNLRASLNRVRESLTADTMAIQKYDVRRPDGVFEEKYWSPINSPVLSADRRLEYIIHRVEDVTEFVRHKAQPAVDASDLQARMGQMEAEIFLSSQKMQAANQKLETANKELEAFSYSVSHDLRAPLRAVDGFSQAILEDYGSTLPADGLRQLQTIRHSAQRMGELIDDLLMFSRLSRQSLQAQTVNTTQLVRSVVADLRVAQAGQYFEVRIGTLPTCLGDPALLKQVWVNLLSNAVKYSRRSPNPLVQIDGELKDDEVTFSVADNGVGFDMKYANKLFGVFQRLHRAEDYEGTGVGLAIVQRIIHRHGGRVWAQSAPNQGATFSFTLKTTEPS